MKNIKTLSNDVIVKIQELGNRLKNIKNTKNINIDTSHNMNVKERFNLDTIQGRMDHMYNCIYKNIKFNDYTIIFDTMMDNDDLTDEDYRNLMDTELLNDYDEENIEWLQEESQLLDMLNLLCNTLEDKIVPEKQVENDIHIMELDRYPVKKIMYCIKKQNELLK